MGTASQFRADVPREIHEIQSRNWRLSPFFLGWVVLSLSACENLPGPYAPPEQRQAVEEFRPYRETRVVDVSDRDASNPQPAVRIFVRSAFDVTYTADFTIRDAVTLSFSVNDHVLDTVRYAEPGPKHFQKAVPADWITPGHDAIAAVRVDGAMGGFALTRIGLTGP